MYVVLLHGDECYWDSVEFVVFWYVHICIVDLEPFPQDPSSSPGDCREGLIQWRPVVETLTGQSW